MMGISWGALAGAFLAPFLYSLYWKKVSKASVWASFIFGAGIMIVDMIFFFSGVVFNNPVLSTIFSSPINCGVVAMIGGMIIVPVVSLIAPDRKNEVQAGEMFNKLFTKSK
jgi:SSS family solute:Na+ symporter